VRLESQAQQKGGEAREVWREAAALWRAARKCSAYVLKEIERWQEEAVKAKAEAARAAREGREGKGPAAGRAQPASPLEAAGTEALVQVAET
jgi:hypothetical protein